MKTFKEKLFHNSFLTYMKTLTISPVANKRDTAYAVEYTLSFFSFLVMFWIVSGFENLGETGVYFSGMVGGYLYGVWVLMGHSRRAKPSPHNLAPISWKKRVVYGYASNFVFGLLAALFIGVFALALMLIISVFVLAATGGWIFNPSDTDVALASVGVQGQLFVVFAGLLIYGAGAAISSIKDKKLRLALVIAFPVAVELIGLLILNCAHKGGFIMTGSIAAEFGNLPLSWLWLTVTAIAAVAVTALSVWVSIKNQKPSKI